MGQHLLVDVPITGVHSIRDRYKQHAILVFICWISLATFPEQVTCSNNGGDAGCQIGCKEFKCAPTP